MIRILLTGFAPFGGDKINPSWEVVKQLQKQRIAGVKIIGLKLPVLFGLEVKQAIAGIKRHKPDIIIFLGQDNKASVIKIERIGINIREGKDEKKRAPKTEWVIKDGPPAYWATLPAKKIVSTLNKHKIPAVVSYHAGTYLCNEILYALRHYVTTNKLRTKVGFIHLPRLPEQVARPVRKTVNNSKDGYHRSHDAIGELSNGARRRGSAPSMSLDTMVKGIRLVIHNI